MAAPDRLETLLGQADLTGIDFVYVDPTQVLLDVFFLRPPESLSVPLENDIDADQVVITDGADGHRVPVTVVGWFVVDGRHIMRLSVIAPGGFADHRLRIDDTRIDTYFNDVLFSFKASCPTGLDCAPGPHYCPPDDILDFPVDYLARDFWSLRRALLDYASERRRDWPERAEADVGVVMAELFASLGDDFAYTQDRHSREAFLRTAVEKRSVRRHARLVDHQLDDGAAARTWLDVTVVAAGSGVIPAGSVVTDVTGGIAFEVGTGLEDAGSYTVDAVRNAVLPHIWDEDDLCLPAGSTSVYLVGHLAAELAFDDFPPDEPPGKWVLLRTTPTNLGVTARAIPVRLIDVTEDHDAVLGIDITRVEWEKSQATAHELDLNVLEVHGNLVPASAGRSHSVSFRIADPGAPPGPGHAFPTTIERAGPNGSLAHRFTLPGTERIPLTRLHPVRGTGLARPEVVVTQLDDVGGTLVPGDDWEIRRSLVGVSSSLPTDRHVVLEDGAWGTIVRYRRPLQDDLEHRDVAGPVGTTLRFGDGEFAALPADGTCFEVEFRLGAGAATNVAPGTLTRFDPGLAFVDAVTNPVPGHGGRDPESLDDARIDAPQAFRAITYRAVRPEDYAEAVERLPWVQRAGATLRWTGSWMTLFATADAKGTTALSEENRLDADRQLDRFRQAGREAFAGSPTFADLDLEIDVCVDSSSYPGEVRPAILRTLFGDPTMFPPTRGVLDPDEFTFGTPLYRSRLEAAIDAVPGVRAVEEVRIRRRGRFAWRSFDELTFAVDHDDVIRIANDRLHPEWGSVRLILEGGA
jgi:hypothetical protein